MLDNLFLAALRQITAGELTLPDLITAAGRLGEGGRSDLAQQLYKIWISFNAAHPQRFVVHFNLASLLTAGGQPQLAAEELRQAVALNPDFLPGYINLGGMLERTGPPEPALEQWREVVARTAAVDGASIRYKITALKQMARVYAEHRRGDAAEAALRESLSIDAHQPEVAGQYIGLRLSQCKWPVVDPFEGVPRETLVRDILPLSMAAYTDDPLLQLACAARHIEQAVDSQIATLPVDCRHARIHTENRRLRIGYISSDLRNHAVGYLMSEVFELHDPRQVEVFAYYCGPTLGDALSGRIQRAVEHWVDIRELSDEAAAGRVAADGIDILVDVNGHTKDARTGVFARRPAPVQVNWLGFPGTMGSAYHQYIIADDWIIPPESEIYYSETVVRLPCYQPNDRKRLVADHRPTRQEAGLPEEGMVFCCFNASQKITRFTFDRFLEILKRVPGSVLWLIEGSEPTHNRLREAARAAGVAPERLVFAPKQHNPAHLARYHLADLFLDTTPYGAHTTGSDALWMGVPVLTLSGRCFASRVCGSLVRAAGIPELVCEHPQDFVERAVALAGEPETLRAIRSRLQAGRDSCQLFALETLVERLESLYRDMAEAHQRGRTPQPDLSNLDHYLDIGVSIDHEREELLAVEDYHGLYRARLGERHRLRPIRPDARLWTPQEVAVADHESSAPAHPPHALRLLAG